MLCVPGKKVNLLLVPSLDDDGYAILFWGGQVFIYPEGVASVATMPLGVQVGRMSRVQEKPVYGKSGWISDSETMSVTDECSVLLENTV